MSLCVVLLCTEHRTGLKDSVEHADHHLFVELRALCQNCRSVEILELKEVCAALCGFCTDLRGMDLGKAILLEIVAERSCQGFLDLESGALLNISEGKGTVI